MNRESNQMPGRWVRTTLGLLLLVAFWACLLSAVAKGQSVNRSTAAPSAAGDSVAVAKADFAPLQRTQSLQQRAEQDPLGFLRFATDNCHATVRDYTCRFRKQERIAGRLTKKQEINVRFRTEPFSVMMHWVKNPGRARRALYVRNQWLDRDGEEHAVCEPQGAIARFLVGSVLRPIHGADARKASRRTIDQFGFSNTLGLILKYAEIAHTRGELDLMFVGPSQHDGRPTFEFHRRLPYTGETGLYPDRLLVFHLDQENLLPVCCLSYADEAAAKLLGSYEVLDFSLNVGLGNRDFDRRRLGL